MKIVKTFRIDKDFSDRIVLLAKAQGITFSQFVELACYAMVSESPPPTKQIEKHKKLELIDLVFRVDQPTYKRLVEITRAKNSTLSQEVCYRVSASLVAPVFDTVELSKLEALHFDLNRLGNLLKLAISSKTPVNSELLFEIRQDIREVNNKLDEVISHSHKRTL